MAFSGGKSVKAAEFASIDLKQTLVFSNFNNIGSSYTTSIQGALPADDGNTYSGWSKTDCMYNYYNSKSYLIQLKKVTGVFTSPTIKSASGFTVKITYGSSSGITLSIGEGSSKTGQAGGSVSNINQTVELTTNITECTFSIKAGSGNPAYVSKIEIIPNAASGPITYAAPKFDIPAGNYIIGQRISLTSSEGTNIVYSVNGGVEVAEPTAANTVSYRFPAPGEYKVKAKAVPAAADDENKESNWTEEVTYNITENIITPTSEVTIWEEDFTDMTDATKPANYTFKKGRSDTKLYTTQLSSGGAAAPELLISKNGGVFTVVLDDLKGCSGEMKLMFKSNNGCTVATTTEGCSVSGYTLDKPNATCQVNVPEGTTSLTLTFTNAESGNTRVDDFKLTAASKEPAAPAYYPLALGALGISTFAAAQPYVMPDGMQGGIVTVDEAKGEATVTYLYEAGDVVPAREALMLKGTAGTEYHLALTAGEGVSMSENCLRPALTYDRIDAEAGTKSYIFANDASRGPGFYFQGRDGDGSGVEGIYGKAYLSVPATAAVRGFVLKDGEATGIGEVAVEAAGTARTGIYTIAGVRVGSTTEGLPAGLYIVDGRKVLVK